MLYRCVQQHLETWLAQRRDGHHDEWSVPDHVEREFRRYLEGGILAHGVARARCGNCGHGFLIALSCKGRGVCPSCNSRRMVATAAHLTDHVLPPLPVRQWVLAVPERLRYFLQRDADLQGAALRLFLRAVEQCLRAHSPGSGPAAGLGAVACCRAMTPVRWRNGNTAVASPSMARCASRLPTVPDASGCCVIAPGHRSPFTACASATASTSSTPPRKRAPAAVARSA